MPVRTGQDLGGVRSLKALRERCVIDPETGCWKWSLYKMRGQAVVFVTLPDGSRHKLLGRRAALTLSSRGRVLPPADLVAFATPDCECRHCVNPAHCQLGTRLEACRAAADRGAWDTPAAVAARLSRIREMANAKLTEADRAAIRASDEPTQALAQRYGISSRHANFVRSGRGMSTRVRSVWDMASCEVRS